MSDHNFSSPPPISPPEASLPAGLAGLPFGEDLSSEEKKQLVELAKVILSDPILCEQLANRVYELMLEDLRIQKERSWNYGRRS